MTTNQVSLTKHQYAYAQLGIPGQGCDLEAWGVPVRYSGSVVTLRVVSIIGAHSGVDYTSRFPFLVGHLMNCHLDGVTLYGGPAVDFKPSTCGHFDCGAWCEYDILFDELSK